MVRMMMAEKGKSQPRVIVAMMPMIQKRARTGFGIRRLGRIRLGRARVITGRGVGAATGGIFTCAGAGGGLCLRTGVAAFSCSQKGHEGKLAK